MEKMNWDAWRELAQNNPAEFEVRRKAALEAVINSATPSHQRKLRGLQFRIDLAREHSKHPLGAAIKIHSMMWAEFTELQKALNELREQLNGKSTSLAPAVAQTRTAQVLPFRPR